jgi:hypothetical protein
MLKGRRMIRCEETKRVSLARRNARFERKLLSMHRRMELWWYEVKSFCQRSVESLGWSTRDPRGRARPLRIFGSSSPATRFETSRQLALCQIILRLFCVLRCGRWWFFHRQESWSSLTAMMEKEKGKGKECIIISRRKRDQANVARRFAIMNNQFHLREE